MHAFPVCLEENPDHARFCSGCGSQLTGRPAEVRKMVTVVIIDIVGSTDLAERLDPEALRGVLTQYFRRRRAALEHHGGLLEKYMGDAIMGIFGVPQVHEDDPPRYPHRLRRAADAEGQGATRGGIPVALTGRPSMREGC